MNYFIPAWYSRDVWWESRYVPFYQRNRASEFDETISLISMYIKNKRDYQIISLSYTPNLRLFLHRYSLFESVYWSVFDEIQGFHNSAPFPLDYKDFNWPANTEFSFTPYIIICDLDDNRQSYIYYAEEGYLTWIEDLVNDKKQRRYVFDDRGFLSSIVYFNDEEKPISIHYLNVDGKEILIEDLLTGTVFVIEEFQSMFNQLTYSSMTVLIEERLARYLNENKLQDDEFIVASDHRHNEMVARVLNTDKKIFTIFNRRDQQMKRQISYQNISKRWIADTLENELLLNHTNGVSTLRVTPFDAFLLPNISSQLVNTEIGFFLDGISHEEIIQVIDLFEIYLARVKKVKIILFSREEKINLPQFLEKRIADINEKFLGNIDIDELTDDELTKKEVMQFVHTPFEEDLIQMMSTLRLVIDLKSEPDLFLQISAISAGLPQINKASSDYVSDRVNGYVLQTLTELPAALDFFIETLKNWNRSFAYCLKLIEEYSSVNILDRIEQFKAGESVGS